MMYFKINSFQGFEMNRLLLIVTIVCFPLIGIAQLTYYVAPEGSPSGAGTLDDPLDLFTAIDTSSTPLVAGDTLLMRGGVYQGTNISFELPGTKDNPCIVRPYNNEKVILEGNASECTGVATFRLSGTHIHVYDLIITQTARNRITETLACSPQWGGIGEIGVSVQGVGAKMINCFIYNCASTAISSAASAIDAEIYGNIAFNNGYWDGPLTGRSMGHGHGLYMQNNNGFKTIENNILFKGFGYGIQFYSASDTPTDGCIFTSNTIFSFGSVLSADGWTGHYSYLIDSEDNGNPSVLIGNHSYHAATGSNYTVGYTSIGDNLVFNNNYAHGGTTGVLMNSFRDLQATNNTVVMKNPVEYTGYPGVVVEVIYPADNIYATYDYDYNAFHVEFERFLPAHLDLHVNWVAQHGFDANSSVSVYPDGNMTTVPNYVDVIPNIHEPKRATIVIHNHQLLATVSVDVSNVLQSGDSYWLYDVEDLRQPIQTGSYRGSVLKIPTNQTSVFPLSGTVPHQPVHSGNDFGTFLLIGGALDIF
jgi:hypothetical protein